MNPLLKLSSSIRIGFATNSSSSHSILLVSPETVAAVRTSRAEGPTRAASVADEDGDQDRAVSGWGMPDRGEYGWSWFALTEKTEKLDYLWTDMYGQVVGLLSPARHFSTYSKELQSLGKLSDYASGHRSFASDLVSQVFEHTPEKFDFGAYSDGPSIDHDSCFSFPLSTESGMPHIAFARWFRDRVTDPNVVVFGGNDNESNTESPDGEDVRDPLTDDEFSKPMTCLDRGSHWLLWNKENGLKLRTPKVAGEEIIWSDTPELADVKLTDRCAMGCLHCYQGSTPKGAHPDLTPVVISDTIRSLGVLEVAIGGGEPLEYPGFWDVVNHLQGTVKVNITTRRLDLIPVYKLNLFGGIGFSTESPAIARKTFKKLGLSLTGNMEALTYDNPWRQKLVLHIVLGAAPMDDVIELCQIAKKANVAVLLLAFKTDGRGASFTPHPHDDWIERLNAAFRNKERGYWQGPNLGVDTPIVERWGKDIEGKLAVDKRLMAPGEGQFSLYVDFVTKTVAKASYGSVQRTQLQAPKDKWKVAEGYAGQILSVFRSWHQPLQQLAEVGRVHEARES